MIDKIAEYICTVIRLVAGSLAFGMAGHVAKRLVDTPLGFTFGVGVFFVVFDCYVGVSLLHKSLQPFQSSEPQKEGE